MADTSLTAAEHTTARPNARYTCLIDLYGTYEQVRWVAGTHLRGQGYYVQAEPFSRNGLEVHRIYLVDRRQYVRLASNFFDACNSCRFCGSFNVLFYQHFIGTLVYCRKCRIQRAYRVDNPSGYDLVNPELPSHYPLQPGPANPLPTRVDANARRKENLIPR